MSYYRVDPCICGEPSRFYEAPTHEGALEAHLLHLGYSRLEIAGHLGFSGRIDEVRQFPKHCTKCPRVYLLSEWLALPYVGIMSDEEEDLQLRNCKCGTTISICIPKGSATPSRVAP